MSLKENPSGRLLAGAKLGIYEILSPLGAGGMGEVYLANDSNLDRKVAIKVLPESMTRDKERVARFEREARVLASLSHPNIAAVHGFDESDGTRFLVMEYVAGETLAQRLAHGALSVDDALDIARKMAEALDAAHERGVIHRDLKPGNVMIRSDGSVKVLDFGLAKATAEESTGLEQADSPTITANYTRPGVVLGTAAYMSPEQARGRPLDKRTDIWSFGIILFECLTGDRLFQGETATDSMGAIMHKEPDWSRLPPQTPPAVRLLLRRCLTKDRKRRLRDIGDTRVELDDAMRDPTGTELGLSCVAAPPPRFTSGVVRLAIGLVLGATLTALVTLSDRKENTRAAVRKFSIPVARIQDYWNTPTSVISPDGRRIAYVDEGKLWGRALNQLEARPVPDSDGAASPFWSPDSTSVGFFDLQSLRLRTFNFSTGTSRTVCALTRFYSAATATWGEKGTIVFDQANGLYEVDSFGGEPLVRLGLDDTETSGHYNHPRFLPGGENLLAVWRPRVGDSHVVYIRGNTAQPLRGLEHNVSFLSLAGEHHLLFQREDGSRGFWAAPLSSEGDAIDGNPFRVTDNGQFPSAATDGTLLYQSLGMDQLVRVSRSGHVVELVGQPQQQIMNPALSPDGRYVAVAAIENGRRNVWIHDIARATRLPLTADTYINSQPVWSPSGTSVYFTSGRNKADVFEAPVGGLGEATNVVEHELEMAEPSVSGDGKHLAFITIATTDLANPYDIWQVPLEGNASPLPVVATPANELLPEISPDGRHLAFISDQTGRWEVFIATFPDGDKVWGPISNEGGVHPKWGSSDELFYVDDRGLMSVKLSTDAEFTWEPPRRLFTQKDVNVLLIDRAKVPISVRYDVDPSGESFVIVQSVAGINSGIIIVQNWLEEFEGGQ